MSLSAFAKTDRPFYKKPLFWLGLALLSMQWRLTLLFDGFLLEYPRFFLGFMTSLYMIPPLVLWQFDRLLSADGKAPRAMYFFGFAVAIGIFLGEIFFQLQPIAEQQRIVTVALTELKLERINLTIAGFIALLLIYITYIFFRFRRGNTEFDLNLKAMLYSYFTVVYIDATLQFAGFFFKVQEVIRIGLVFHTVTMLMIIGIIFRYPKFFSNIRDEVRKQKYARTSLSGIDVKSIKTRITELMVDDEMYLDEGLRIQELADSVLVSVNQLSRILNEQFGQNFYEFVNGYRVKRAQELLIKEPGASILDVAYRSGFNSKSTFHQHFAKFTGVTPTAYRNSKK